MSARRAENTTLEPGQHSIDRVAPPRWSEERGGWVFFWAIRLMDGRLIRKRTQSKTSAAAAKRKARREAARMLREAGAAGQWTGATPITTYIDDVTRPAIEAADLRPQSKRRYLLALDQLVGAGDRSRQHRLQGHTIASLTTAFTTMERVLLEIADRHGKESARQAKTVLSKYVVSRLVRDGLAVANPLRGETIARVDNRTPARPTAALTADEYSRVVDHLLQRDPARTPFPGSAPGRREKPATTAKHERTIMLTLLQAATGLRIGEALHLRWSDVAITDADVHVTVHASTSKTGRARTVPVLDPAVAGRLRAAGAGADPDAPVIGSPADPSRPWDAKNARAAVASLFTHLAEELAIPTLKERRSHLWRATLNTLTANRLPDALRAAYFGHSIEENTRAYTAAVDTRPMVEALAAIRDGSTNGSPGA